MIDDLLFPFFGRTR